MSGAETSFTWRPASSSARYIPGAHVPKAIVRRTPGYHDGQTVDGWFWLVPRPRRPVDSLEARPFEGWEPDLGDAQLRAELALIAAGEQPELPGIEH